jgi:sulfur carrier protein
MNVLINKLPHDLPERASLADAISALSPALPFAAAVNMQFVPKASYSQTLLKPGDQIEIIRPVTGG